MYTRMHNDFIIIEWEMLGFINSNYKWATDAISKY